MKCCKQIKPKSINHKNLNEICLIVQARLGSQRVPRKMIKPFCDTCPVFRQCLDFAMSFPDKALQGLWANTTEGDRRRMRYGGTPSMYSEIIPTTERSRQ